MFFAPIVYSLLPISFCSMLVAASYSFDEMFLEKKKKKRDDMFEAVKHNMFSKSDYWGNMKHIFHGEDSHLF